MQIVNFFGNWINAELNIFSHLSNLRKLSLSSVTNGTLQKLEEEELWLQLLQERVEKVKGKAEVGEGSMGYISRWS